MHEFNIIQNIFPVIEKIVAKNHFRVITEVILQVGKLRQVIPENLQFAFSTLAKGTLAENAKLTIIDVPIEALCQSCQKKFIVIDNTYFCPYCGSADNTILTGKEIILESVIGEK